MYKAYIEIEGQQYRAFYYSLDRSVWIFCAALMAVLVLVGSDRPNSYKPNWG